jgi:hypothetical protein
MRFLNWCVCIYFYEYLMDVAKVSYVFMSLLKFWSLRNLFYGGVKKLPNTRLRTADKPQTELCPKHCLYIAYALILWHLHKGNLLGIHHMYISFKMPSEKQIQLFNILNRLWTERAVHRDSIPGRDSDLYHLFRIPSCSGFHTVPLEVKRDPITYHNVMQSLRMLGVVSVVFMACCLFKHK